MNKTIETILAHLSVRDFEDRALSPEQIETLVKCAQAAATSSFQQAYTIIGVTDSAKKKEIAKLALNQDFVAKSGFRWRSAKNCDGTGYLQARTDCYFG